MRVLVVNRHALPWTTGERGAHVPAAPADRFLMTSTFGGGLAGYDPAAFPNVTVIGIPLAEHLETVARWLVEAHAIDRVVALHEKDLLWTAALRADHGLPGLDPATTLRFRDKLLMKDTLAGQGYPGLPRYRTLARGEVLTEVPWAGGSVVKSRWGLGSSEVRLVADLPAANAAARELEGGRDELEVEEFITGAMYHCDSVVEAGEVRFAAVSEYLAQPGHYGPGQVAGSVLVLDGPVRDALLAENALVLRLLGLVGSAVTHVEFFRTDAGRLVFCEAAARPAGGGISDIVERAYGVDLVRAAVRMQCGVPPGLPAPVAAPDRVVGVVGIYHSAGGGDRPVDGLPDYAFGRQEVPGQVRHCTDYAHTMFVSGRTRAEFDDRAAAAVATVRAGG